MHRVGTPRRSRSLAATLLVLGLLTIPATAAAHADLATSNPTDGSSVAALPDPIVLTFSEAVQSGSAVELRDPAGSVVATGVIDAADATHMTVTTEGLSNPAPGAWEIRWTSVAADGDIERGTIHFTVTAPTPPPAATSAAPAGSGAGTTPVPSAAPTTVPGPTSTPTTTSGAGGGGGADVLIPIGAAVLLVAGAAWWIMRRRSPGPA